MGANQVQPIPVKLCVNCKHCVMGGDVDYGVYYQCHAEAPLVDKVTGSHSWAAARHVRENLCKDAWYEAKASPVVHSKIAKLFKPLKDLFREGSH